MIKRFPQISQLLWSGVFFLTISHLQAQQLKLDEIMQGYDWIGHSPKEFYWALDSKSLYFNWNPDPVENDSIYKISLTQLSPEKVSTNERVSLPPGNAVYDRAFNKVVYIKDGDLFYQDLKTGQRTQFTNTVDPVSGPAFTFDSQAIVYTFEGNLYQLDLSNGSISQLTQLIKGSRTVTNGEPDDSAEKWLYQDQMQLSEVLKEKNRKQKLAKESKEKNKPKRPLKIYLEEKSVSHLALSPDQNFITYRLTRKATNKQTQVPDYVTESGFTENISARSKAGASQSSYELGIYDRKRDSTYLVDIKGIPGIDDLLDLKNSKKSKTSGEPRQVIIQGPVWSDDGTKALIEVRAMDNKDRWIMTLDLSTGLPSLVDRQQDHAWINGPGIGYLFAAPKMGWLPDNQTVWFLSESSGYVHLYTVQTQSRKKKAITSGPFEIYDPQISRDKDYWYYGSNQINSGERHFYRLLIQGGGEAQRITFLPGRNDVILSPDESWLAIRHSSATQPEELYLMRNPEKNLGRAELAQRITFSQKNDFKSYPWREPQYITFEARDGVQVPARLYLPEPQERNGPAIIFVHGAGYLQNAHKWWSSYYREYMFHNFLVDQGYTVLDIDYRGSAGYGRDWRTAIYQHMGGKDLTDQIDGAKYLVEQHQVSPNRLGIYGGSYGGFITLMAMFKEPDTFAAGAALRSVADWAHYNHGYTSNILNQPLTDSLAYVRSSPIYYAEGLKGHLLILHGMVDTNVHFQDVVRLSQRLIELGKDNWELAVYPKEGHGFEESSSWVDEYKRIFKLFEEHLN